jgi:predicted RNA-binding protein YlqC (UPF0109 family)
VTLPLSSPDNDRSLMTTHIMKEATDQIKDFLQFIALQFIEHPDQAELRVAEVSEDRVNFRLIVAQSDVAILIGRNGFTASAIRNVMKAAAIRQGMQAGLQIHSHEEERQRMAAIEAGEIIDDGSGQDTDED